MWKEIDFLWNRSFTDSFPEPQSKCYCQQGKWPNFVREKK